MRRKNIEVYFCPKCKSTDVQYIFGLGNLFGIIPRMRCFKCGYISVVFPVLVVGKKKIKPRMDADGHEVGRRRKKNE